MVVWRKYLSGIAHCDPSNWHRRMCRQLGAKMHHPMDPNFRSIAQPRSVENTGAGGDKNAILESAPYDVRMRPNQTMRTNPRGLAICAANHSAFHHDAILTKFNRLPFGNHASAEQNAAARANRNVATYRGVRRDVSRGVNCWCLA